MQVARCFLGGTTKWLRTMRIKRILEKKLQNERHIVLRCLHDDFPMDDTKLDDENEEYNELRSEYINPNITGYRTFIIQPYVKWGENKRRNTTPELQLEEAAALVQTLPNWRVVDKICIPLLSLQKTALIGKGNMEKLKSIFHSNKNINALFVSKNILRPVQTEELQNALGVPVFDRYSIVIRIFHEHAKTPEAKLQVALAEIPYLWKKLSCALEDSGGSAGGLIDTKRMVLQTRKTKLRNALTKLKEHRKLLRRCRLANRIPSVAVVGYTNSGKTSLIKALTGDESLVPRNQLFATLDTTSHQGVLPCSLKVLYMDTIGFIQDVPDTLIEPFIATFEDAMIADIIVHVFDISHPDRQAQIEHVEKTLEMLITDEKPIIHVANKCDLAENGSIPDSVLAVSSIHSTGIDLLRDKIEKELLAATGRNTVRVRVRSGCSAYVWLYKETAVTNIEVDPNDAQYLLMDVIATPYHLHKFRQFLKQ